ncbi:calcium/sodium antiporter [Alphaproteobacteria bacterium]|nr:calcium/sodium antiporter [Alphaproteobacteria bacterium]MDC0148512.1 calcium/sodium antiporter [Alphaproteobacteria bacterium]
MESPVFFLLSGFILLGLSGEALLRGAVTTAVAFRVPPLIIGLTIIALGTSAPEFTVSVQAALIDQADIAVGNVIGSNIANILLVMGTMALIQPFTTSGVNLKRDGAVMLIVSGVLVGLAYVGVITAFLGVGLLAALVVYLFVLYRGAQNPQTVSSDAADEVSEQALSGGLWLGVPVLVAGLFGIIWGADLMVTGAVALARDFGISEAVIALSIVAIGTSLPELAVSVVASLRGQAGLAVGNIIGSNISNILLILGGTALLAPLPIADVLAHRDVWVMFAVAVLGIYFMASKRAMSRAEGGLAIALYAGYIAFLYGV